MLSINQLTHPLTTERQMKEIKIPKQYMDMVGTKQTVSGNIFSNKKLPDTEMEVLNIRLGTARVVNMKELTETGKSKVVNPTFELLLKGKGMKRAQWSKPFAIREINLKHL